MSKPVIPLALAAFVAAAPLPAMAEDSRAGELAERLNDPVTQYAIAGLLSSVATMALDLPAEPLARAAEAMGDTRLRDLPPDARLGDIAGPEARELPERIREKAPRMVAGLGAMAGALEEMLPELRALAGRLRDAVPAQ